MAGRAAPVVVKLACDPAFERARARGWYGGRLEEFEAAPDARLRLLRRQRDVALGRATRLVIPSRYLAAITRGWRLDPDRVSVVPNPAPDVNGGYDRARLRERFGIAGPTLVFAGRLVPQKNLPLAIAALADAPAARLVVVGDGPDRGAAEDAVAEAGVGERVRFVGALPREGALEWVAAADAAVLPSDWENFPHAAVEALATGTPMIATAVGGVPEIVEPGVNGMLVAAGDREAMAAAMRSVAADPELRATLRAGARATAVPFGSERVFGAIEAELERAVRAGR
jgi:glycosyltransferase involved in cell wall biosynthesis